LVCAHFRIAVRYIVPWFPDSWFLAYLLGIALLVAGLGIATNNRARLYAFLLGFLCLLCALIVWLPKNVVHPLAGPRTLLFETLAFSGSALTLTGVLPAEKWFRGRWESIINGLIKCGPSLFAVSLLIFGLDHFLFLDNVASLVPTWLPGSGVAWAIVTGLVFIFAGVNIATGWMSRWGSLALATMFLLWFFVLHLPGSVRASLSPIPETPNRWSSAFIALGMCAGGLISAWHAMCSQARTAKRTA
jgi:uncharacterized membrane protein YphA (DoxX/SURF4 family)